MEYLDSPDFKYSVDKGALLDGFFPVEYRDNGMSILERLYDRLSEYHAGHRPPIFPTKWDFPDQQVMCLGGYFPVRVNGVEYSSVCVIPAFEDTGAVVILAKGTTGGSSEDRYPDVFVKGSIKDWKMAEREVSQVLSRYSLAMFDKLALNMKNPTLAWMTWMADRDEFL